jgi:hypothetical protein
MFTFLPAVRRIARVTRLSEYDQQIAPSVS